jgi:hypothetical protein
MKKPQKNLALNMKHLTSTYLLKSIIVEDSQIEWDDHFEPRKLPCRRFEDGKKYNMHFEAI